MFPDIVYKFKFPTIVFESGIVTNTLGKQFTEQLIDKIIMKHVHIYLNSISQNHFCDVIIVTQNESIEHDQTLNRLLSVKMTEYYDIPAELVQFLLIIEKTTSNFKEVINILICCLVQIVEHSHSNDHWYDGKILSNTINAILANKIQNAKLVTF
jgi:hypothetical protein